MLNTFHDIRPGQTVHYRTPQGEMRKGRACRYLLFPAHVVVDTGRGRPRVVDATNYVRHGRKGSDNANR
jgi:hypothetical protein